MTDTIIKIEHATRHAYYNTPQTPSSTLKGYPIVATSFADPSPVSISPIRPQTNRKRSRNDSWDVETPGSAVPSPSPFANMNYRLAGGFDTPTAVTSQYSFHDGGTPDVTFRRGPTSNNYDYFHDHSGEMIRGMPGRDGNGKAQQPIYQPQQLTWGSLVFGLAGKVFDFCTVGTFRGFFSGGGQGYTMNRGSQPGSVWRGLEESQWLDMPTTSSLEQDSEDYRASKKSKIGQDNSWVVVKAPSPASRTCITPRPASPALFSDSTGLTRQSSNASTATIGRPSLAKRPTANLRRTISTRPASSAGLRSSDAATNEVGSAFGHRRNSSLKKTPPGLQSRRNSYGLYPISTAQTKVKAPLSAGSITNHQGVQTHEQAESPLAKETRRHLDTIRKQELAEDREIMKMNRQLKDLIKQGQEALGTKVEVDYEGDDW